MLLLSDSITNAATHCLQRKDAGRPRAPPPGHHPVTRWGGTQVLRWLLVITRRPARVVISVGERGVQHFAQQLTLKNEDSQYAIWLEPLAVGQSLPTMPLALRGVAAMPLDLDGTYQRTCEDSRL